MSYSTFYGLCSDNCERVSNRKFIPFTSIIYSKYGYRLTPIYLERQANTPKDYDDNPYPSLVPYYGSVEDNAFYRYSDKGTTKDQRSFDKIFGEDSNLEPSKYDIKGSLKCKSCGER